jgi:thiol-disulfide isomerase/thioredoxin
MRYPLIVSCLLASIFCFSQSAYKLQFKVDGLKDTTAYLGYFMNEGSYIKDTAQVDGKGQFVFEGNKPLKQGIYFLVLNKVKLFDFVIGKGQQFVINTKVDDYLNNMKVTGDEDNKLYFENMTFEFKRHKEAEPFIKILKDSLTSERRKKEAEESFNKIRDKVLSYQSQLITKHPNTVTATLLKMNQPVQIPSPPIRADGTVDSTFQLRWYREHFFDNFDLSQEALIQMPKSVYKDKIYEYLDKLYAPHVDTLTKAVFKVIDKAKANPETYKYAVWTCLVKYQRPEFMGLDELYVNIYDKYFASGEMNYWANEKTRKIVKDEADRIRRSMIGRVGANLIMLDSDLKPKSMHDIKNKYTILYIFSPDCGFCKTETPKLVNFYNEKKFDLEVYAVSSDSSMVEMKDYIKDMNMKWITVNGPRTYVGSYHDLYDAMTTPTIYVLNEKKIIIGKKVPVEKLEDFLKQYERIEKLKTHHR